MDLKTDEPRPRVYEETRILNLLNVSKQSYKQTKMTYVSCDSPQSKVTSPSGSTVTSVGLSMIPGRCLLSSNSLDDDEGRER